MDPDFYDSKARSEARSTSKQLPSTIDTLDDAIAYLLLARQTMGGNTKFRLACGDYTDDCDEYREVSDIVLRGNKSLLPKARRNDDEDYVLFVYE